MSDNGMPTCEEITLAELQRVADENYTDLLDQMDEAWGQNFGDIGGAEIRAFLESRVVHKPATRLRNEVESLRAELAEKEKERLEFVGLLSTVGGVAI